MSAWIPVTDRLPEADLLVQVRVQGLYEDAPYVAIGYMAFPRISDGNVPIAEIPLDWFSGTRRDHKGRAEDLHNVTHWAPLLDPELEEAT